MTPNILNQPPRQSWRSTSLSSSFSPPRHRQRDKGESSTKLSVMAQATFFLCHFPPFSLRRSKPAGLNECRLSPARIAVAFFKKKRNKPLRRVGFVIGAGYVAVVDFSPFSVEAFEA